MRNPFASMAQHYRDTVRHGGIYAVGQILSRLASVLLLPLYTRYLVPADYGAIAILDLTTGMLGILLAAGMVAAVGRYHFDAQTPEEQSAVWWTGLAVVGAVATAIVAPALIARQFVAAVTIGPEEPLGGYFYALALPTLWMGTITLIPDQYLRVRKWSVLSVCLSFTFLVVNVMLNVYFLAVRHMGVAGVLWGNLITGFLAMASRTVILAVSCRPIRFNWPMAGHLWRFGSPLVLVAIFSTIMHQADRFILRIFVNLSQVGVYALAYTIGQGVNSFFLSPFFSVWDVVVYEIAKKPDAKRIYVLVFQYFFEGLLLLLLGVSLFAEPVLQLLVPPEYHPAGRLIPVVCLAFVFFSIHGHFRVPALVAKKTGSIVIAPMIAAVFNIAVNLLLIPIMGPMGAALTSVLTYAVYAFVGLREYRRIERYDYAFARCGVILAAMSGSYVVCLVLSQSGVPTAWSLTLRALVWTGWALALAYPVLKKPIALQTLATTS